MLGISLVPKSPVDYRAELVEQLKVAAIIEAKDAINSLESGTLDAAQISLHRAQLLTDFATTVGTQKH